MLFGVIKQFVELSILWATIKTCHFWATYSKSPRLLSSCNSFLWMASNISECSLFCFDWATKKCYLKCQTKTNKKFQESIHTVIPNYRAIRFVCLKERKVRKWEMTHSLIRWLSSIRMHSLFCCFQSRMTQLLFEC